jgi:hypothetical protein
MGNEVKEFSTGRRVMGYTLLGSFALALLGLVVIGVHLVWLGMMTKGAAMPYRVLMMAAGVASLYVPLRVAFAMMQRRLQPGGVAGRSQGRKTAQQTAGMRVAYGALWTLGAALWTYSAWRGHGIGPLKWAVAAMAWGIAGLYLKDAWKSRG